MRYNLYRGGADIALEREAFHRANEARAVLANSRRLAEQEARFSYNALDTARARSEALAAKAEAQRRTRDAYAQQFEIGQRQLLDLLDAENELFLNRVELTTAVYTERFATYRVLAVVGDLLNTLEVVAPREAISVHRSLQDLKTPEVIEQNAGPLADPQSEPRPLRGVERGEPAQDQLDMAPLINRPPAGPGPGAALPVEPAATMADIPAAAGIVAQLDQPAPGAPTVLRLTDSEANAVSSTGPATLPASAASPTSDGGGFLSRLFRRPTSVD
jgi:outer membrane protein, adhesin transport system